ncbi:MAG: hypothetical protein R3D30_06955 [Hyphomicrobiales bacterium]
MRAVLRAAFFVVRFLLVAMSCSDSVLMTHYPFLRRVHRITLNWSRLAVPQRESIIFLHYKLIAAESGNLTSTHRQVQQPILSKRTIMSRKLYVDDETIRRVKQHQHAHDIASLCDAKVSMIERWGVVVLPDRMTL